MAASPFASVDLPAPGQSGEQHREALPAARREGAAQLLRDLGEGEPVRDLEPEREAAPELGAAQRERPVPVRDPAGGQGALRLLRIHDLLERDHRDAELVLVLGHQRLRVIGPVEGAAVAAGAGGGVVASDDEVGAAVVPAHDRVPEGLARPGHAHREIEQAQDHRPMRETPQHPPVAAHPGVAVDIAGRGLSHDRMEEKVRLARAHGLAGELDMGAVQRVAGLERDDTPPAELAEAFAQRGRAVAQRAVIVVGNRTEAEHAPARIDRMRAVQQVGHAGVGVVDGAVDRTGLLDLLGPPRLPDLHDGDRHAFAVAKRDRLSGPERGGEGLAHVERHRDRPQRARGQAHGAQHALVTAPRS